jgi:hypothetical protein
VSETAFVLRFLAGSTPGVEFPLRDLDRELVIGRAEDVQLVLDDSMVSRRHARIFRDRGRLAIEDLGSTNGIFVNAHRVQSTLLKDGDRIQIGTSLLKLTHPQSEQADRFDKTAMLLPEGEQPGGRAQEGPNRFGGVLEEIPMPDLLQLLSSSKKSGVLEVLSVQGAGSLFLRAGQVYYATVGKPPLLWRHKALYRMLGWQSGSFELLPPDERRLSSEIEEPTHQLLLEAMRQLDEIARLRGKLPPRHVRLEIPGRVPSPRSLSREQLDVLKIVFDNPRITAGRVLDLSPMPDLETYEALLHLGRAGFLTVAKGW